MLRAEVAELQARRSLAAEREAQALEIDGVTALRPQHVGADRAVSRVRAVAAEVDLDVGELDLRAADAEPELGHDRDVPLFDRTRAADLGRAPLEPGEALRELARVA